MAVYERRRQTHNIRYNNEPSFSSSLLDAVYRSIDETRVRNEAEDFRLHKKKPADDEDAESLRRAIMIEKWIDNHSSATSTSTPCHLPSNSGSSTDSSTFSSTETESSASKSTPKKLVQAPIKLPEIKAKSKSRAQKIYRDLKKVKEPISPGGKIANFLNSIFSPRNTKPTKTEERGGGTSVTKSRSVNGKSVNVTKMSSVIKSRSVNDTKTSATRSCLSRNQFSRGSNNNSNSSSSSSGNKSKRSVRFCPVGVIVDEDSQACGHKSIYGSNELYSSMSSSGAAVAANSIGSQYIKKNIDSLRVHEVKNTTRHREFYYYQKKEKDFDDMSCASSDLFELENIGRGAGSGAYEEDQLPVYGTTSFKVVAGGGIW